MRLLTQKTDHRSNKDATIISDSPPPPTTERIIEISHARVVQLNEELQAEMEAQKAAEFVKDLKRKVDTNTFSRKKKRMTSSIKSIPAKDGNSDKGYNPQGPSSEDEESVKTLIPQEPSVQSIDVDHTTNLSIQSLPEVEGQLMTGGNPQVPSANNIEEAATLHAPQEPTYTQEVVGHITSKFDKVVNSEKLDAILVDPVAVIPMESTTTAT